MRRAFSVLRDRTLQTEGTHPQTDEPPSGETPFETAVRAETALRLADLPVMVHSLDRHGRLIAVNDVWLAKLGYRSADVLGRRIVEFYPQESAARVLANLPSFFATGRCENLPLQMLKRDGDAIDVLLSSAVCDEAQMGAASRSVLIDVTQFSEMRRRLHESEARYRFLAEHSSDMILLIGADGRRLYASPASQRILGYTPEEAAAQRLADVIHPDDAPRILPVLAAHPERTMLIYRMRHKDGGYVWVETTGNTVEMPGGERQRLIIVRDIEKRVASEERLKANEALYRRLAENSSDVVFQLDRNLVCEYASPSAREVLGYAPELWIGQRPRGSVHRDDVARYQMALESLLRGGAERLSVSFRLRHRNGRWLWLEAQVRALKDTLSGQVCGIIGALRDISARKTIEDELADANLRLQRLAALDPLTGLANRRAFDEALAAGMRSGARLALVMIDVDNFKAFNDRFGHPAGDDCLKRVAQALASPLRRPTDIAARYGGEEFAVVARVADETEALTLATAVRDAVAALAIAHPHSRTGFVTISAGLALSSAGEPGDVSARLLRDADRALYAAKTGGRNAVVLAPAAPPLQAAS